MRALLLLLFLPVLLIAAWILSSLRPADPRTVDVAPHAPARVEAEGPTEAATPARGPQAAYSQLGVGAVKIAPLLVTEVEEVPAAAASATESRALRGRVAGHVTVNGCEPRNPLVLTLASSDQTVWKTWRQTMTDHGRFEFANLPEDWSGELVLPPELELADAADDDATPVAREGNEDTPVEFKVMPEECSARRRDAPDGPRIELARPDSALEVRLVETTALVGRVVRRGDPACRGSGLVDRIGKAYEDWSDRYSSFTCDPSTGRFCIRLGTGIDRVDLSLADAWGLGGRTVDVAGPFDGIRDLGDLELAPTRIAPFRVLDERGAPVTGAQAVVPDTYCNSGPTDAEGRGAIAVDAAIEKLLIGKPGYEVVEARLPAKTDEVLEVRLRPAPQLVVDVRLANGAIAGPGSGVYVNVLSSTPMFLHSELDWAETVYQACGATAEGHDSHDDDPAEDQSSAGFRPGLGGRVLICGLQPGSDHLVELRSVGFDQLLDSRHVTLGAGEARRFTLSTESESRALEGIVETSSGRRLGGAIVWAEAPDSALAFEITDDDGRFRFPHVFADRVKLQVGAAGFEDLKLARLDVPAAAEVRTFRLAPSQEVPSQEVE